MTSAAAPNSAALTPIIPASLVLTTGTVTGKEANTVTVKVEHVHPCFPPPNVLQKAAGEKEADAYGWEPTIPRQGHEWSGLAANAWRAEQEHEREEAAQAAAASAAAANAAAVEAAAGVASASASVVISAPTNKTRSHKKSKSSSATTELSKIDTGDLIRLSTISSGVPSSRKRSPQSNANSPIVSPTKNQNAQLTSGRKKSQEDSKTGQGRRASIPIGLDVNTNGRGGAQNQQNQKRRASGANGNLKVDVSASGLISPARLSATSPTTTRGSRSMANSLGSTTKTKQPTTPNGRSGGGGNTARRSTKSTPV